MARIRRFHPPQQEMAPKQGHQVLPLQSSMPCLEVLMNDDDDVLESYSEYYSHSHSYSDFTHKLIYILP
jgi:hypothetical protein